MLVLLLVAIVDAVLALKMVECVVHMLIAAGDKLLHGIEGGEMSGAWAREASACEALIDLKDFIRYVVVLVTIVIQIIIIIMGAKQRIVAAHLVAHRNRHATRRIMRRLLVAHPQRIHVLLLANGLLQAELVARKTHERFGAYQFKGFRIGQNALDFHSLLGGAVHLQAAQLIELIPCRDGRQFQSCSILALAGKLICLDHASIIINAGAFRVLVIPGVKRLRNFCIGYIKSSLHYVIGIPTRRLCAMSWKSKRHFSKL